MAHLMNNTDKNYPCTQCGSSGNIIREGADPRLKCNNMRCNFMYNGSDSLAAVEANAIPESPPELDDPTPERTYEEAVAEALDNYDPKVVEAQRGAHLVTELFNRLPRTLRYLVVAKNRVGYEFCNEKQFRKTILKWEASGKPYEVFELTPKSVTAKVDIK